MNDPYDSQPLSKEAISYKLERIDKALSKLDSANASYLAPDLSKDDLFDIFMEARDWLLAQLNALGGPDTDADVSHESLEYTYQTETMRNRIERST